MTTLDPRADFHDNVREATTAEIARAEGIAARIRAEIAEIRDAAEQLAAGSTFEAAVAEWLRTEATVLERNGGTARAADYLRPDNDTQDRPGMLQTSARSALLIARAYNAQEPTP